METSSSGARVPRWSLRLGRLLGVDVRVHATFFILLLWLAGTEVARQHTLSAGVASVAFTVCIFGCVVLHELGHALVARRQSISSVTSRRRWSSVAVAPVASV